VRSFRGWLARRSSANLCGHDFYIIETGATAGVSKTGVTITHLIALAISPQLGRRERYRENSSPQRG